MKGYPYLIVVCEYNRPSYAEPYATKEDALLRLATFDPSDETYGVALMDLTRDGADEPFYSPDDSGEPDDAP